MGARRMSRGACAHAWSAGDLGSWLRVQGVENVVDLDAGELVLVGERFLDGGNGVLMRAQELLVGLDGVDDEVAGVEWPGVVVGAPGGCGECDGRPAQVVLPVAHGPGPSW